MLAQACLEWATGEHLNADGGQPRANIPLSVK